MVVAQYTGIGLQKDDNAFVKYNESTPPTGQYDDNTVAGNEQLAQVLKQDINLNIETSTSR